MSMNVLCEPLDTQIAKRYAPTDHEFAMLLETIAYAIESSSEGYFDHGAAKLLGVFAQHHEWSDEEHTGFRAALQHMANKCEERGDRCWLYALHGCFTLHPVVQFALDEKRMNEYARFPNPKTIVGFLRAAVRYVCSGSAATEMQLTMAVTALVDVAERMCNP